MNPSYPAVLQRFRIPRGLLFGSLIIAALFAFEVFNYSTTEFALSDLLGELSFAGVRWSTILAIAFCGIDFAGIARIFTPEQGAEEPTEVWYLFGAWLLAAAMNAMLTWWGVSIAILNHETLGNAVVPRETLLRVVPIFVAVMVWLIRVLIIGTFSVAGERLFTQAERRVIRQKVAGVAQALNEFQGQRNGNYRRAVTPNPAPSFRPSPKAQTPPPAPALKKEAPRVDPGFGRPEPTYHPLSMSAKSQDNNYRVRRG
jgi:hypothetical protein